MPTGRASGEMKAPAYNWLGLDALSLVGPTEVQLLDICCSSVLAVEFSSCFNSVLLDLDLYDCCFDDRRNRSPSRGPNFLCF